MEGRHFHSQLASGSAVRSSSSCASAAKAQRVVGVCTCGRGLGSRPCCCKKARANVYSKEVYAALNTRGGALWERLLNEAHGEGKSGTESDRRESGFGAGACRGTLRGAGAAS